MADIPPSTFRRDPDFGRNRVEPRRYGVGRYGVGRYSPSDPTRFAWERVTPAALALLLSFFIAVPATADTLTPGLNLIKISEDVEDPLRTWGSKEDENKDILDAAICDKRTGCTITGQLIVQTTIQAAAIIAESSVSVQAPLTGDGLTGTPIGVDSSSVTLIGVDALNKTGDTMTGQLTLDGSTLTVTGNAFSVGISTFIVTGGKVGIGTASPVQKLHMSSGTLLIDGDAATSFKIGTSTLVVTSDGKVGIGTASPGQTLTIGSGQITVPNGSAILPSYSFFNNTDLGIFRPVFSEMGLVTVGIERIRIDSLGFVGIGTTLPLAVLDIKADTGARPQLKLQQHNSTDGWELFANATEGDLLFSRVGPNAGEKVRISSNGNVGIGTTNPTKMLTVASTTFIQLAGEGLILTSPDGTCSACGVNNSDAFSCASVTCP